MKPEYQPPESSHALLLTWIKRSRESQFAHYAEADRLDHSNRWMGIIVIVLTSITATTLLAVATNIVSFPFDPQWLAIILSTIAAILSTLHLFLRHSERGEQHRTTGARYGSVRRMMEEIFASSPEGRYGDNPLSQARETLDNIAMDAPNISLNKFSKIELTLNDKDQNTNSEK